MDSAEPDASDRFPAVILWASAFLMFFVYSCGVLTGFDFDLFHETGLGLTYNSMLDHLIRGDFGVDAGIIKNEGFRVGDHIVTYFGIAPALLRIVLIPFGTLGTQDITAPSIAFASAIIFVSVASTFLAAARSRDDGADRLAAGLVALLIAGVAFSGPQIQFLKTSLYQEAVQWALAETAVFVCLVYRTTASRREFSVARLSLLAVIAGLTLSTRVSTGIGLYAGLGLLLAMRSADLLLSGSSDGGWARRISSALGRRDLLLPLIILLVFVVVAGLVNFKRWGNPLTFADLHLNILYADRYLDRLPRLDRYGEMNLVRLPYGIGYYFFPTWALPDASGPFHFADFQWKYIESAELPPSSFLWSDPLLCLLAAIGATRLVKHAGTYRREIAIGIGLAIPAFLMLCWISMTFRYRSEFYGALDLLGAIGCQRLLSSPLSAPRRVRLGLSALAVLSILAAHANMMLYRMSDFGSARELVSTGSVFDYFAPRLAGSIKSSLRHLGF